MGNLDVRRAVIDVGTNSVKLLVAEVNGTSVSPIREQSRQTRLGAGFYQSGRLRASAIEQTAQAAAHFAQTAAELGAQTPRLIGTSAARDAANVSELVEAIRRASGLEMAVLSGSEEADWVFRGVATDPKLSQASLLILDIGGGSTEFIVGERSVPRFAQSCPLGSVRLIESLRLPDPPGLAKLAECRASLRDFLQQHVSESVESAMRHCVPPVRLVCAGGTATILARMEGRMGDFDRQRVESTLLTSSLLRATIEDLWQKTLAARQAIPGLPPNRADVILTGAAILDAIMEKFNFSETQVSTRGLRYWALLEDNFEKRADAIAAPALPTTKLTNPGP